MDMHVVMHEKPAVSCPFFWSPSHCIPEAKEDLDIHFLVYIIPFWNKFIVDETMSIAQRMDRY
jgi:hypothetical protein